MHARHASAGQLGLALGGGDERHRLFFALLPPPALRERAAAAAREALQGWPGQARAVDPSRYHLTLHFLGETSELPPRTVTLAQAAAAGVRAAPFELSLDRVASFRAPQPPCVLLAAQPPEGLTGLWQSLGLALARAGLLPRQPSRFVPHLTFAYSRGESLPERELAPLAWTVQDFVLLHRRSGAAAYGELGRWPLGG